MPGAVPRFLGLSTGRAGSRYFARLLNEAGIPTVHEKSHGPPWDAVGGAWGEVSAHLVPHVDAWPEARVWHFTRHPQPFVASLMAFGFWQMDATNIHPHLEHTGDELADSYRYWIEWNRRILAVPEPRRTTFQIERLDRPILARLTASIGARADLSHVAPCWDEQQSFAPVPDSVAEDVRSMMERLGYA